MFRTLLLTATCVALLSSPLQAKDIHVSPFGDDRNAGTRSKPIRSLDSALARTANVPKSTIWLASGRYQRSKTLAIGKQHRCGDSWTLIRRKPAQEKPENKLNSSEKELNPC